MYSVRDSVRMDDIWVAPVAWQAEIELNVLLWYWGFLSCFAAHSITRLHLAIFYQLNTWLYVNFVFSAWGEKSGALGVTYKCIDSCLSAISFMTA